MQNDIVNAGQKSHSKNIRKTLNSVPDQNHKLR